MREAGGASGLGWCLIGAERERQRESRRRYKMERVYRAQFIIDEPKTRRTTFPSSLLALTVERYL